jgi:glycosyltransferase involved in cell wall biosynthesis
MRVCHVVSSLQVGGAERFVVDLSSALQQQHHVDISIANMGDSEKSLEQSAIQLGFILFGMRHLGLVKQIIQFIRIFLTHDIVHVHSTFSLPRVVFAKMLLPFGQCKLIYTRHNERVHKGFKWESVYLMAKLVVTKFVFVAEKARVNFLNFYPSYKAKSVTVLNGVLPINKSSVKSSKLKLGQVGRFVKLKAQTHLLKAIAELSEQEQAQIEVHFYGEGPLFDSTKQYAESISHCETFFHGLVADRDIIYSSFDVLVVTSETEGLSLAILEALASRLPIIATNVGGNPELVKHEHNGFLYEFGDTINLANKIKSLLSKQVDYLSMSQESFNLYNETFSMKACAHAYFSLYSEDK